MGDRSLQIIFSNPLGLKKDGLGEERKILKHEDSNLTLSVKPDRPHDIVFEKGLPIKI